MSNRPQYSYRKIPFIILILICVSFLLSSGNFARADSPNGKKITMVFTRPKHDYFGRWIDLIFTEAFKRIGLELVFESYPAKRCSYLADEGMVDGELGRIYSYNEGHPNLVRVEESITSIRWAAYSVDHEIRVDSWDSFKGTDYKVDYRRGLAKAELRLSEFVKKENLTALDMVTQGLKKLATGRTDIYVDVEETTTQYLVSEEFDHTEIRKIGLIEEETLHAFLHKKNKSYAPKLSGALKEMKEEGLFEKYKTIVEEESRSINIE